MLSEMPSQSDKARVFHALHAARDGFVVPNPWDVGSARLLSQLGFKALATTSAGHAFSLGGSIEDSRDSPDDPLYGREFAAERIRAAAEAARSLPFPFTLTVRAENYFVGRPDLANTIGRLQAYQEAGADVLSCAVIAPIYFLWLCRHRRSRQSAVTMPRRALNRRPTSGPRHLKRQMEPSACET